MSTELGDLEQAAACFRKAIDAEPDNMRYHLSRCSLLEQVRSKAKKGMAESNNFFHDQVRFEIVKRSWNFKLEFRPLYKLISGHFLFLPKDHEI